MWLVVVVVVATRKERERVDERGWSGRVEDWKRETRGGGKCGRENGPFVYFNREGKDGCRLLGNYVLRYEVLGIDQKQARLCKREGDGSMG